MEPTNVAAAATPPTTTTPAAMPTPMRTLRLVVPFLPLPAVYRMWAFSRE